MKKKCNLCHITKELIYFHKNKSNKDGYQRSCISCMKIACNKSRKKKQKHYTEISKKRRQHNADRFKQWKEEKGCYFCNEKTSVCLELHHFDSNKEYNVGDLTKYSFEFIMKEAEKCIVVCANCHRKLHYGFIEYEPDKC